MLTNHMILDHCWVCGIRFTDANPPGPANREDHHIVPQKAGGTDGPQVSLCDAHHTKAHKIALRLTSQKPYFEFMVNEPELRQKKLLWLASVIHNSFQATKNDPNKRVVVAMAINQRQQQQIEALKRVYPSARSREAVLSIALEALFQKHFTNKP
jgi:hypothetical protein